MAVPSANDGTPVVSQQPSSLSERPTDGSVKLKHYGPGDVAPPQSNQDEDCCSWCCSGGGSGSGYRSGHTYHGDHGVAGGDDNGWGGGGDSSWGGGGDSGWGGGGDCGGGDSGGGGGDCGGGGGDCGGCD